MTQHLNADNGGAGKIPTWIVGQLLMTSLVPVWAIGLRALWRSHGPVRRGLTWAYALLFLFFALTTGGKIYYLAGAYVPLLAAGVVALDPWLAGRVHRLRSLLSSVALTTLVALPLVLPVSDIEWTYRVNQVPAESVGWPELVSTVRKAWEGMSASEQAHAVLVTADYGEAGAINELGRGAGLPVACRMQNSEWWWGPGNPRATRLMVVAPGPRDVTGYVTYLRQFFRRIQVVATLGNDAGLHNQEWGGHVYLCTGLVRPWTATWPLLRHYD